jgi:molecular chaperone GrpE
LQNDVICVYLLINVFQDIAGKESGTVVVVSKIGYKLHDRVIRPALVGVSK